jgi:ferrochelatase
MRNWTPFIVDAVAALAAAGVARIIAIPLAPQFSTLSVAKYLDAAKAALPPAIELDPIRSFHAHPLLLDAFAERIAEARPASGELVVFTAHSLPTRVIEAGDTYAAEFAATADGVARRARIAAYRCAYQSAGRTPEPWVGPGVADLIRDEAAAGVERFLVVPVSFVCDHTETLFDIDIEARAAAEEAGAVLRRTESLNCSPTFIRLLEQLVRDKL